MLEESMEKTLEKMEREVEATARRLRRTFTQTLLKEEKILAGQEKRLLPNLDVSRWDRLHFHFSNGVMAIKDFQARILFGTPMSGTQCSQLLADSTIWFEDTVSERDFIYTTPVTYNGTGFVMSVPVIAPRLFDVILRNVGTDDLETIYVTLMAQEI
jgi:hypothetical protein